MRGIGGYHDADYEGEDHYGVFLVVYTGCELEKVIKQIGES